ncbi:MAG: hypothetical protein AAB316_19605 [Bacteroidota bacterium]
MGKIGTGKRLASVGNGVGEDWARQANRLFLVAWGFGLELQKETGGKQNCIAIGGKPTSVEDRPSRRVASGYERPEGKRPLPVKTIVRKKSKPVFRQLFHMQHFERNKQRRDCPKTGKGKMPGEKVAGILRLPTCGGRCVPNFLLAAKPVRPPRVRRRRLFAIVLGKRQKKKFWVPEIFSASIRPAKVLARGSSPALPRSCLPCKANFQA